MADLVESESSRSSGSSETGTERECTSSESCVSLLRWLRSPRPRLYRLEALLMY